MTQEFDKDLMEVPRLQIWDNVEQAIKDIHFANESFSPGIMSQVGTMIQCHRNFTGVAIALERCLEKQ